MYGYAVDHTHRYSGDGRWTHLRWHTRNDDAVILLLLPSGCSWGVNAICCCLGVYVNIFSFLDACEWGFVLLCDRVLKSIQRKDIDTIFLEKTSIQTRMREVQKEVIRLQEQLVDSRNHSTQLEDDIHTLSSRQTDTIHLQGELKSLRQNTSNQAAPISHLASENQLLTTKGHTLSVELGYQQTMPRELVKYKRKFPVC